MNNTTLTMVAVIMAAAFMVTAFVWQQQQTQAQTEAESSSTTCINDQPCHTSASNSSIPYSPKSNHNRMTISTTCINDQPCHTSARNSTQSLSQNYPSIDADIADLNDDITG